MDVYTIISFEKKALFSSCSRLIEWRFMGISITCGGKREIPTFAPKLNKETRMQILTDKFA
jgi:hypothetical protein